MSTPMVPRKRIRERWDEFKTNLHILLHREAIVLDLVKASFPLYAGLGLAMVFGFGYIVIDGNRDAEVLAKRSMAACADRNSQTEQGRVDNVNLLVTVVEEQSDPTAPEMQRLIAIVSERQHDSVEKVDRDCDADGYLTSSDYSSLTPPNLPIKLIP